MSATDLARPAGRRWTRRVPAVLLLAPVVAVGLLLALDAWPRLAATGSLFNAAGGLVVGAGG